MTVTASYEADSPRRAWPRPKWTVIARHELADLWFSSKGLSVLFGFTLLLAVLSYLVSADAGINLLDARESVGVIVQTAIALGALTALVISSDAISVMAMCQISWRSWKRLREKFQPTLPRHRRCRAAS